MYVWSCQTTKGINKQMKEIAQLSSKMVVALCIPRGNAMMVLGGSLPAFAVVCSECFASSTLIIILSVGKIFYFFLDLIFLIFPMC